MELSNSEENYRCRSSNALRKSASSIGFTAGLSNLTLRESRSFTGALEELRACSRSTNVCDSDQDSPVRLEKVSIRDNDGVENGYVTKEVMSNQVYLVKDEMLTYREAHNEFEEVCVAISKDVLRELEGETSIDDCIQNQELENAVLVGNIAEFRGVATGPIVQQPDQTNVKREPNKSILNTKQVLKKPKQIPSGPNAMARDRFFKLRKHLHFVNVHERPPENTDRLWKVRPLYDVLRNRMSELTLETALCVDEQMIPFKGRLNIKQYVKAKPNPWGFKLFALCGTSGIMYDFVIYQGSTTELNPDQQDVFGLGAAVVLKLAERISEPNIQLYFF
ncbi:transposase is4 [Holotrichia oblita]|uniref:Transposase is4 n=1 Tax=Holotrichia oblita TaxID=644536 RepID=A0ACB9TBP1_HOLOL|nr:transposase is4 [Holotrichia oblita]